MSGVGLERRHRSSLVHAGDSKRDAISWINAVSDGYFATLGIPILAGRDFDTRDTPAAPKTAIVSESMAREVLRHNERVVGRTFQTREGREFSPPYRIIGVVGVDEVPLAARQHVVGRLSAAATQSVMGRSTELRDPRRRTARRSCRGVKQAIAAIEPAHHVSSSRRSSSSSTSRCG